MSPVTITICTFRALAFAWSARSFKSCRSVAVASVSNCLILSLRCLSGGVTLVTAASSAAANIDGRLQFGYVQRNLERELRPQLVLR